MNDYDQDCLSGWTKEDKFNLFTALKCYRSNHISEIKPFIPNKSSEEITQAINYYKDKAKKQKAYLQDTKLAKITKLRPDSRVPLARWASLLTDSVHFEELQTDTPTAIRLIADMEDLPYAFETQDIDFRKVYHQIANAMEGKPLLGDKYINAILKKCIIDTALTSRSFMKSTTLKLLLSTVDVMETNSRIGFPSHSDNAELSILRKLALKRSYNPLNIPEEYLKPSAPIRTKREKQS